MEAENRFKPIHSNLPHTSGNQLLTKNPNKLI
jgi:hypothetical protein